jgi:hypothetical protein
MYHAHKHLGNVGTRDMQRPPPLMETDLPTAKFTTLACTLGRCRNERYAKATFPHGNGIF